MTAQLGVSLFTRRLETKVSHMAQASDVIAALINLDPIYSVGVELAEGSSVGGRRAWHVTLVSAEAYEPIFADGYLLNGTNAAVSVSVYRRIFSACYGSGPAKDTGESSEPVL